MKKGLIVIIAVCLIVVMIITSIAMNLTGKVVRVGFWNKQEVYTVEEVDKLIADLNSKGESPIYYTKSEIDNLLKNLAQNKTTIIESKDTYTKSEINNLFKNQFNECYKTGENSWDDSCQNVCNKQNKKCLLGQFFIESFGSREIFVQQIVGCADIPSAHFSESDISTESDTGLWCVCC